MPHPSRLLVVVLALEGENEEAERYERKTAYDKPANVRPSVREGCPEERGGLSARILRRGCGLVGHGCGRVVNRRGRFLRNRCGGVLSGRRTFGGSGCTFRCGSRALGGCGRPLGRGRRPLSGSCRTFCGGRRALGRGGRTFRGRGRGVVVRDGGRSHRWVQDPVGDVAALVARAVHDTGVEQVLPQGRDSISGDGTGVAGARLL